MLVSMERKGIFRRSTRFIQSDAMAIHSHHKPTRKPRIARIDMASVHKSVARIPFMAFSVVKWVNRQGGQREKRSYNTLGVA